MKFLAVIFTFYILLLSVSPCCTDDSCIETDNCEHHEQTADNHKEDSSKNGCSPFFICGNCSGFVFSSFINELNPVILPLSEFPDKNNIIIYYDIFHSIWQPPRLG